MPYYPPPASASGASQNTPANGIIVDHCMVLWGSNTNPLGLGSTASGAGTGYTLSASLDNTSPGVVGLPTGTTGTGRTAINNALTTYLTGFLSHTCVYRVQLNALFDGTEQGTAWVGFGDNLAGDPADGVFFHASNGAANWLCRTRSNNVQTSVDSGVPVVAAQWYVLKIVINVAGTQADFYIDGTLVASINTNVPGGSGRSFGLLALVVKAAGTTSRILYIDFLSYAWSTT